MNLEQIGTRLKTLQNKMQIKAKFKQLKHLKEIDVQIDSEGQLLVNRLAQSIRWTITQPYPNEVLINPKGIKFNNKESSSEYQLNKKRFVELFSLLSLDAQKWDESFDIYQENTNLVKLLPKNSNTFFELCFIEFDPQSQLIRKIDLHEKSGDLIEIAFQMED